MRRRWKVCWNFARFGHYERLSRDVLLRLISKSRLVGLTGARMGLSEFAGFGWIYPKCGSAAKDDRRHVYSGLADFRRFSAPENTENDENLAAPGVVRGELAHSQNVYLQVAEYNSRQI